MIRGQGIGNPVRLGLGLQAEADAQMRIVSNGAGAMIGEMPEKALPSCRDNIMHLIDRTVTLAEHLELIGDRVFGGLPIRNCEEKSDPRSGEIGAINDALDTLSAQIARAHDAMTRLETL